MKFVIQQFRGVKAAELDVDSIAFVAGKNFHGKTSLAQACGLVLTGETMPGKLAKKNVDRIIHGFGKTAKTAMIAVSDEQGSAKIDYPAATFSTAGTNPSASRVAVGIDTPSRFTEKELSGFLTKFLGTAPTKADLLKAVKSANLKAEEYENLWHMVERDGWDAAHAKVKTQSTELKGEWRRVTGGETYGSQKGESWHPADWTPELETMTADGIEAQIFTLEGESLKSIRRTAVDAARLAELNKYACDVETARQMYQEKNDAALKLAEILKTLRKKPVPKVPTAADIQACPKCKAVLAIKDGRIVAADSKTPLKADVEAAQASLNLYNGELQTAETAYTEAASARDRQEAYLNSCEQAKLELDRIEADKAKGEPERSTEDIQTEIDGLKAKIRAIETYSEARKLHERIMRGEIIAAALAEDGVRKDALETGLAKMNASLASLCTTAGWNTVSIDADLAIWFGEVPYEFCSESEQYRVNATIQLHVAANDDSAVTIFDRADLLDSPGRNGFMKMIQSAGIPAIVCITMNAPEQVPDMSRHGITTWWIEKGELKRL